MNTNFTIDEKEDVGELTLPNNNNRTPSGNGKVQKEKNPKDRINQGADNELFVKIENNLKGKKLPPSVSMEDYLESIKAAQERKRERLKREHGQVKESRANKYSDLIGTGYKKLDLKEPYQPEPKLRTESWPKPEEHPQQDSGSVHYITINNAVPDKEPAQKKKIIIGYADLFTFKCDTYQVVNWGFWTTYKHATLQVSIPVSVKNALLKLVPVMKAWHLQHGYLQKAYVDETVSVYLSDAVDGEELNDRKIKVQQFYWADADNVEEMYLMGRANASRSRMNDRMKNVHNEAGCPTAAGEIASLWRWGELGDLTRTQRNIVAILGGIMFAFVLYLVSLGLLPTVMFTLFQYIWLVLAVILTFIFRIVPILLFGTDMIADFMTFTGFGAYASYAEGAWRHFHFHPDNWIPTNNLAVDFVAASIRKYQYNWYGNWENFPSVWSYTLYWLHIHARDWYAWLVIIPIICLVWHICNKVLRSSYVTSVFLCILFYFICPTGYRYILSHKVFWGCRTVSLFFAVWGMYFTYCILLPLTVYNIVKKKPKGYRMLLLWDELPFISIVLEELIKSVHGGTELIGFLEYLKYGTWANYYQHLRIKGKLSKRIEQHISINQKMFQYWNNKGLNMTYGSYLDLYKVPLSMATSLVEIVYQNHLSYMTQFLPSEVVEVCCTQIPACRTTRIKGEFDNEALGECKFSEGVYPILFPLTNLKRPAKTAQGLKTAIVGRLNVKTTKPRRIAVNALDSFLFDHCTDIENISKHLYDKDKWFESLNPKQRKDILRDRVKYEHTKPKSVKVDIKSDEILYDNRGDVINEKDKKYYGRVLFNLSGWWLDQMGLEIDMLTDWMKKKFNCFGDGRIVMPSPGGLGYRVYVPYFTCGATSKELDIFYNLACEAPIDEFWFMVMGDDMASAKTESDFSKYDRTQDYKLYSRVFDFLGNHGFSELAEVWKYQYKVPKYGFHRKTNTYVKVDDDVGGMTGQTGTCWINSLFNIAATVYAHHWGHTDQFVVDRYLDWGFEVKYSRPKFVSFLKGTFIRNNAGLYQWDRFPSFLGKFGKVLTNYCNIVTNVNGLSARAAHMLWSQWLGYGNMQVNAFTIALHQVLKKICLRHLDQLPGASSLEKWQVQAHGEGEIPNHVYNEFLQWRYGFDLRAMDEVLQLLNRVEILPVIYTSRVVDILVRRDYG